MPPKAHVVTRAAIRRNKELVCSRQNNIIGDASKRCATQGVGRRTALVARVLAAGVVPALARKRADVIQNASARLAWHQDSKHDSVFELRADHSPHNG